MVALRSILCWIPWKTGGKPWVSLNSGTILHSDQGAGYTCVKFIQFLKNSALRMNV